MHKIGTITDRIEEVLCIVAFSCMCLVVLWSVLSRYFFMIPFPIGDELARYLMIYGIFMGISIGIRKKAHLGVEAVVLFLPEMGQKIVDLISQILSLILYLAFFYFSIELVQMIVQSGQTSPAMRIPMWIAYLALPIGFGISSIRCCQVLVQTVKRYIAKNEGVDS